MARPRLLASAVRPRPIGKTEFDRRSVALRTRLLRLQFELRDRDFPVVLQFAGGDRESAFDVVNRLTEWLDARLLDLNFRAETTDDERARPRLWRWFTRLPAAGRIGVFPNAWAGDLLAAQIRAKGSSRDRAAQARRLVAFEREIFDAGGLIVKIWFHLDDDELRRRRKASRGDPLRAWDPERGGSSKWKALELDDRAENSVLAATDHPAGRWRVVRSADREARDLAVGTILADALERRLAKRPAPRATAAAPRRVPDVLGRIDLAARHDVHRSDERLAKAQGRLNRLAKHAFRKRIATVLVFEGPDAAGKGGAIRRVTRGIRAPVYRVVPISAPSDEESRHHWLWRFWREVPRAGHFTIFDRSWYGRVLVERVERFAPESDWRRAYGEIVDFEQDLLDAGIVVVKFWIEVSPKEQAARFAARGRVPFKKYKLTPEDFRNRAKRPRYRAAANEMFLHTDRAAARWHVVPGDDKPFARAVVVETICRALERALG